MFSRNSMVSRDRNVIWFTSRETRFTPRGPARGELRSTTRFVGDSAAAVEKLKRSRKVRVETEAELHDENGDLAGELLVSFYVRLMPLDRLKAMAGALTPRMAGEKEAAPS